jgi:hypothetical protein
VGGRGRRRRPACCLYSRLVNAEFNWWLLIVGLVIGGGLTWLVLADSSRREVDIEERELDSEARWIAETLTSSGRRIDDDRVREVLRLHRAYRTAPPPDDGEPNADELEDRWIEPGPFGPTPLDATDRPPIQGPLADPRRSDRGRVEARARLP